MLRSMKLIKGHLPILLLFFVQIISGTLVGQDINENNFVLYTKQDGLSHSSITGLIQDSIGYVWMSTPSGLNRFNGSYFAQFHSNNDSLSLPSERLAGLVSLDSCRLAALAGGLHVVNTRTGETKNLFVPYADKQYEYKFNWAMSVRGNNQGDIFILSRSGFYHFDKDYNLVFRFDYYPKEKIATETFAFGEYLIALDSQRLAIVSRDGIYYYDGRKKEFRKMQASDCPAMAEFLDYPRRGFVFFQETTGTFVTIDADADSLVYVNLPRNQRTMTKFPFPAFSEFDWRTKVNWFNDSIIYITGKTSGFFEMKLNPGTGKLTFYPRKYFQLYACRQLMKDRDNNLWIATNKGLLRQDDSRALIQRSWLPPEVETRFPYFSIDDVRAAGDKMYVATRGTTGLLLFDKQSLEFSRRISFAGFNSTSDNILALSPAGQNALFVGTDGPLFRIELGTDRISEVKIEGWKKNEQWIADLFQDRNQNTWIASDIIYKYDALTGKSQQVPLQREFFDKLQGVNSIREDASGNIWISGHGILRYNTRTSRIDLELDSFPSIKIPDKQVNSFTVGTDNNIWLSSNNNGLLCYSIESGKFCQYTRDDGLPDNNISDMIIVGHKLWIAAYTGLACLDLHTYKITSFTRDDGFPDLPISNGAKFFYDSAFNKLYIGFGNILVRFDPDIIYRNKQSPKVFVESITTGNREKLIHPAKNIRLPSNDNELTVNIGSVNFYTGNSQRFAYRILKDDSSIWQDLGLQNTFSVSNLSPGFHRIQVKLYSINNRWPDQLAEFSVYIIPPFWKRTWFLAICAVAFLMLTYLLLRWRTRIIRRKERAKTHIQKLKAEDYKNQFELEQISNYFSSSLEGKHNVEEVLWDVTKNLIGRMNYEECIIYIWNEDKTKMVQKAAYGPKGNPKAIRTRFFDVSPGQGIVGYVMQTREPQLVPDTRNDPRYRVDDMNRLSELCVPIIHNDELIGIIDSEHQNAGHFRERDMKILTTIATLVGNKIKQIESEQSLEIKQKEITLINQQLAEAQLSALQTQMNPHFIFNSLNSIKGMILENEQQKASRYLSKFANMIRITLNQSKEIFTNLYENIEHLENYLLMEKLRFDDSFNFLIIVDDDIDKEETLIPSLMIQPLAENAIWHGLMYKKGMKNLTIRFSRMNGVISCIIEDNGIGINHSEQTKKLIRPTHKPVGLSNLRNRIEIMNEKYDTRCTLEISDLSNFDKNKTGTRAILRFSVISNKLYL